MRNSILDSVGSDVTLAKLHTVCLLCSQFVKRLLAPNIVLRRYLIKVCHMARKIVLV